MAEHRHEYPVIIMCRALEVSGSGYYAWWKLTPSQQSREDAQLAEKVKTAFQTNRRMYGSPRVHAELRVLGMHCARKRVARLMREQGLFAQRPAHSHDHHECAYLGLGSSSTSCAADRQMRLRIEGVPPPADCGR